MQTHETSEAHVNGFVLPPTRIVGDSTNNFPHQLTSRVIASSSNDFYDATSLASFASFHGNDHAFMEGIPLPNASIGTFENQENTKYGIATSGLDVVSPSLETMLHSYGGIPFSHDLMRRTVGRASLPPVPPARSSCYSREWPMIEQLGLSSHSRDSSLLSNEYLSLSLVTSRPSHEHSIHEQCSSSCFKSQKSLQHPPPLTRPRFLEAIQEILGEVACYALKNSEDFGVDADPFSSCPIEGEYSAFMAQKQDMSLEAKKKNLLSLLIMVDNQYSQCLDEIHTVTSAFHVVTELEPDLHAHFALRTISFVYKSLRERISSHIFAMGDHQKAGEAREGKSFEECFIQKQWALQQLSKRRGGGDHQLWRPQRGLPETSVSVLRTWMFQNFLHPYPKDSEKHLLALKSGLTRNQVSNWFINARVRLWKPMIEEMCAEMNGRKARKEDEAIESNDRNQVRFETSRSFTRD